VTEATPPAGFGRPDLTAFASHPSRPWSSLLTLSTRTPRHHSHPTRTVREAGTRHMTCAAGVSSGSSRGDAGASTRRA